MTSQFPTSQNNGLSDGENEKSMRLILVKLQRLVEIFSIMTAHARNRVIKAIKSMVTITLGSSY